MWASLPLAAGLWAKAVSPQTVRSLALCERPGAGPGAAEVTLAALLATDRGHSTARNLANNALTRGHRSVANPGKVSRTPEHYTATWNTSAGIMMLRIRFNSLYLASLATNRIWIVSAGRLLNSNRNTSLPSSARLILKCPHSGSCGHST